ncbi:neutral zinc metallopeptidase [Nonomuraea sp. NPDC049784]|uniref:neutral zinc metallopeptidase n=1 Tax=Nonomuraea sp. NPDC049784 TaxID=3154361 RepID=UPI0033C92ED5
MKPLMTAALAAALMAPLAGTATAEAAAYPVKHPKLIANPLYDAGPLPTTTCTEPEVKKGDRKLVRAYVDAVIACLETAWEQHLTGANLTYSKIKVRHVAKIPKTCGFKPMKDDSQMWYCEKNSTLFVQIGKAWLTDPGDLWLFETTAYMYGYHVQNLTGIQVGYDAVRYRNNAEYFEQERRYRLQKDCLAGAFLKSVWPMEGRTTKDWDYYLSMIVGDARGEDRDEGKVATRRAWSKRGFATGDPGSCNTWTAASSKVA